jgi:hypothetical protein
MSAYSPLGSPQSATVKVCRRQSCTRLELEWSCGLPHPVEPVVPLELHRVSCDDMDGDEVQEGGMGFVTTDAWSLLPAEPFDEAPYAVHARTIRSMWAEPDTSNVLVRGKYYLDDQVKVPAGEAIGKLLHVDMWTTKTPEARHHIAMHEETRPQSVLAYCRDKFPDSLVFIVNLELPNADNVSVVAYWLLPPAPASGASDTSPFHRLVDRFCNGNDDDFRDKRFKLIPNLVEGPWILQSVMPNRPALSGTKLTQHYFRRSNYFELDLDVSSSTTAQYIGALAQSWAGYLEMDLYMTIQGEDEDELPERILGGLTVKYLDLGLATQLEA